MTFARTSEMGAGAKPSNSRIEIRGSKCSRCAIIPATIWSTRGAAAMAPGSAMISPMMPRSRANSWPATSNVTKVSRASAAFSGARVATTLRAAFEWSSRMRRANVSARSAWTSRIFAAPSPSPSGKAPLNCSPRSTLSCADRVSIRSASIVTSPSIASTRIATGAPLSNTIAREVAPGPPSRWSKARRLTTGRTSPRRFATPISALGACGTRAVAGLLYDLGHCFGRQRVHSIRKLEDEKTTLP